MSHGFAVLESSDIPGDWECAICQESDQKDLIIAHVRYIRGMDKREVTVYSNEGEKHPIHKKCLHRAIANNTTNCLSCGKELYDIKAFASSKSSRWVTRSDGTQSVVGQIAMPFFRLKRPLKELPSFKE